jgi:DNA-binding MurR/RpiR family transcriptional regulator
MCDALVLELIKKRYGHFTSAQRQVADYIAKHVDDIAFMRVDELAAAAGVSPATVVRFATELGFDGYTGLNSELRNYVRQRFGPLRGVEEPLGVSDPVGAFRGALLQDQEVLKGLATRLDGAAVTEAVDRILRARRVWVIGFRSSSNAAAFLAWGFQLIRGAVDLLWEEGYLPERLLEASPRDVLVAFSFARYYRSTIRVVQWAAKRKLGIVVVSDSPVSPAARLADVVLTIPYHSRGIPGFTIIGTVGVVDGLLAAAVTRMSRGRKARMVRRIKETEATQSSWMFWGLNVEPEARVEVSFPDGRAGGTG